MRGEKNARAWEGGGDGLNYWGGEGGEREGKEKRREKGRAVLFEQKIKIKKNKIKMKIK